MKKISKLTKSNIITFSLIIIAYVVVEIMIGAGSFSNLLKGLLVPLCTYIILAVSLNLTVGILGELSLGHAGFMCVGAFSSAVFTKCLVGIMPMWLLIICALLVGALCAALFGFLIGIPVLRLRGDYLAIVTLAFGEIIKNLINIIYMGRDSNGIHFSTVSETALNLDETGEIIIKGAQGITRTPQFSNFTLAVVLLIITLIIVLNLIHSRTGRAVMAIRDDRIAAESIGLNVTKYKLLAFTISATIAGIAGVLYAHNLTTLTASPKNFGYNMSIMILVYVVLGGIGNIRGSIISTLILVLLPELLRGLNDYRMLVYAIVLIVTMLVNWSPKALELREVLLSKITGLFKKGGSDNGNA